MMQVQMRHGLTAGAAPGPNEDLPAVYVAYHDREQYSSIRNLRGVPNIGEKPLPDEMVRNEPPSSLPSQLPSAQPAKQSLSSSFRPSTTTCRSTLLKASRKNVTHSARSPSPAPTTTTTTHSPQSSSAPSSSMLHGAKSALAKARSRATRSSPKEVV